jgi:diguanylate cyclase (GGDEF)-like protein/PAS domain S-box-containing protein
MAADAYGVALLACGAAVVLLATVELARLAADALMPAIIGIAVAVSAGLVSARVPGTKRSITAAGVFVSLLLLLHGAAAAAIGAAASTSVAVLRRPVRPGIRLARPASAAIAVFAGGLLFERGLAVAGQSGFAGDGVMFSALLLCALGCAGAETVLLTVLVRLRQGRGAPAMGWPGRLRARGIAAAASAAIAAALYLVAQSSGVPTLILAVPVAAMLVALFLYYSGEQQAAEREAAQAARHMAELRASERRFHSAFTHASTGMALATVDGTIQQVNLALCILLGHDEAELVGHGIGGLIDEADCERFAGQMTCIAGRQVNGFSLELRCRHRIGVEIWVAAACSIFDEAASGGPLLIFQMQDVTARRAAEDRLQHIAYHDPLTNLANRARFNHCLQQAIDRSRAGAEHGFAVLFLDFDRFKLINDSLGHRAGDEFLVTIAGRIREHVRPTDVVARLGGDEFAILTEGIELVRNAVSLAERLQRVLRTPVPVGRNEIATSASIGITVSGFGYTRPDEVLRDADIAMYKAKERGKAQYALFDASLHAQVAEQLQLETDLRRAIDSGRIALDYQPLYELQSGRLVAFEALARWNHPERGVVPPAVFIPIAEEAGLIGALTRQLIECACAQLAAWRAAHPAATDIRMHVNISGADLCTSGFAERTIRTILTYGLQPRHLVLEIGESMLMERLDAALATLEELSRLGVGVSVDDFGTGYSSLAYLAALPINSLKIDRSFVGRLQAGADNAEIVRAVITLGTALGKRVIAEGIENSEQMGRLRELGCELGQGYHMSWPVAPGQADLLLAAYKGPPPRKDLARPTLAFAARARVD